MRQSFLKIILFLSLASCNRQGQQTKSFTTSNMLIRMAALEIVPEYLDDYLTLLKEESEASVRLEPGVICIYPMFEKKRPTQIRILEIYADSTAYVSHLQTPHFIKYKTSTAAMVKSLHLIDMSAIDETSMPPLFRKLN